MKIGIDFRSAANLTGTGVYTSNLYKTLVKIDRKNQYFTLTSDVRFKKRNVITKILNAGLEIGKTQLLPLKYIYKNSLDLLHFPANVSSYKSLKPNIVTIHDLGFLFYPIAYDRYYEKYLKYFVALSARHSDAIITVSESTKKEIVERFNIEPQKIWVTYEGISDLWSRINANAARSRLQGRFNFADRPYILSIGELIPRKNHEGLIRAFALLCSKGTREIPDLVFAGPDKFGFQEKLMSLARELKVAGKVHFCGYVNHSELMNLLNACEMLSYVSFYEGFGIPMLEAMHCEIPVLSSNTSCMPEIAGAAALLVRPAEIEEIAEGIEKIIFDTELKKKLCIEGKSRAKLFSWEKAAQKTIEVYETFDRQC